MADDTYPRGYRHDPHDRGGASDSGPATDPLTELARLIGQSDPFSPDRNRQPDPRRSSAYPQSADWRAQQYDPQQQDPQHYDPQHYDPQHYDQGAQDDRYGTAAPQHYAGHTDGSADQYASYQNGYAYPQADQHAASCGDQGYAEQPYHPEQRAHHQDPPVYPQEPQAYHPDQHPYHQDQAIYAAEHQAYAGQAGEAQQPGEYAAAQAHQPVPGYPTPPFFGADPNARPDEYYEDAPAPRRGWMVTAAALVGLAVVGTAGAFAYRAVFTGGAARIISRDLAPSKITPAQANQDNANKPGDRLAAAGQNEKLGPPPEQPMTIPEPPRTVPPAITQTQAMAPPPAPAPAPAPVLPAAPSSPNPVSVPADTGSNPAPRKVRTEKINPQPVGDAQATRPAGPIRNVGPTPAQPRVVAPAPPANSNAPLSLAPQGINSAPDPAPAPAPEPRVHTTAIAPPPPVERSGGGSGYYVQLSAQKSEEEARSSFRGIQARHTSLLGGHQVVVRRKDLGSRGIFYGAQVGPFSRESAAKLCKDLEAAGQSCMVQRN